MGEKVNEIRKSIVGMQGFNFSEHAYPLVAALNEAGFDGGTYELNRKNLGTLIEQVKAAETALAAAQAHVAELRALLESVKEHGVIVNDAAVNAALVRESSTEALREFGLKVATAIIDRIGQVIDRRAVVNSVLRGES